MFNTYFRQKKVDLVSEPEVTRNDIYYELRLTYQYARSTNKISTQYVYLIRLTRSAQLLYDKQDFSNKKQMLIKLSVD